MTAEILTVTLNPALDVTTSVERFEPHVKMRCRDPVREPGGGGINVSRMIARLGGESCAFFPIGGVLGAYLRDLVEAEGVSVHCHDGPGITRETLQVVDESRGEQYRFVLPGPIWSDADRKRLEDDLFDVISGGYRWVVASGSLPPGLPTDFFARLAGKAEANGARFILDSSGDALRDALAGPVFLVKPDAAEIASLARALGADDAPLEETARHIVASGGAQAVIYTQGRAGATLITESETVRWRPPEVAVKSLTGAGDSFLGAAVLALSRGETLATATRWGVAAAAATASTEGTALADRDAVEARFAVVEPG